MPYPVPLTVRVKAALPAVAVPGLKLVIVGGALMVKVELFEVTGPAFTTVTEAVPLVATLAAATVAVN